MDAVNSTGTGWKDELRLFLGRFGRRLRLRDGWLLAQRTLPFAALAALLIQGVGRLWPVENLLYWTLAPLALWLVGVLGYSLLRPMPALSIAHRVDAELHLKERLSTALALSHGKLHFPSELLARQQQDALAAARRVDPRQDFTLQIQRRPLLWAAGLLLAAVVLAYLPNPMDAVLAERRAIERAAERQAERIEQAREEIEEAEGMSPEQRDELLRQLAELARQLRENPGDLDQALADLSRLEETLKRQVNPNADAQQAMLEALAAQLQSLAQQQAGGEENLTAAEALRQLAEQMQDMEPAEREAAAQALAQMAARAAQAGDSALAQALAGLAQAAQAGDMEAGAQAAQAASDAIRQSQQAAADQEALERALSRLQSSRQEMAQAGQNARARAQAQGQNQGQGQGQGQGQNQGQGQGQGQGQQPGGGGGGGANQLPPGQSSGSAGSPQGPDWSVPLGELDGQVYVPRERLPSGLDELFIPGQDTGQGETQVTEQRDPLAGATGPVLVPYQEVYQSYLDAANQAMDGSYIPSGLKDYVREYFSQLEP